MRVVLDLGLPAPSVNLDDIDDFKHFALIILGSDFDLATRTLEPYGRFVDRENAVILPTAVKELSGRVHDAAWLAAFEAMVFHAREAGWIDDLTSGILAHCEWVAISDQTAGQADAV
jgi:hypothetical protein